MKKHVVFILTCLMATSLMAQPDVTETEKGKEKRMQWFKDAKLGIFIHYGIYAVNGIDESWSFFNGYINYDDYMKQLDGFTAAKYDAGEWAKIIKASGAKYAVLTTKHHDGVALWDTKTEHFNTVDNTPAKRDIVEPFVKALRKEKLKVGLYYSLIDWSYPDYPAHLRNENRYQNDDERWNKFTDFYFAQMNELSGRFNPDLYWFDGDWEHSAEEWKSKELRELMLKYNKNIILNSRLQGYGDYDTPEQGVPIKKPNNPYWELCMTMNDSWGYQHNDHNYKTPYQLIRIFVDCISMGGNLLLDIGPHADGSIPQEQLDILKEFGRWTSKHEEAIYGTLAGIDKKHFNGPTALSKDGNTLYLYVDNQPNHPILVNGLDADVEKVRVVGQGKELSFDYGDKVLSINMDNAMADPIMTVLAVELKRSIKLVTPAVRLEELALGKVKEDEAWGKKHQIALDDMTEPIPGGHYNGATALSKDKNILYLMVDGKNNGPLIVRGLKNKINRIWVVGNGTKLSHKVIGKQYWSDVPGITYIDLPEKVLDKEMTVIAVLLDGELDLYRGKGHVIESN
ncbi:alpha-L-fucosidase [Carboxylicivirga sediminis]|uniref:alpha-L-fucosidase n=1 Tax=Carboxylicivirga sediminis TaxID=2006564 RepID=A0A941F8F6_9BACT|nr:alpha-L-fucosidase [Carboxylicivirga sediminis]MBR8537340.1 alpha-L-fucosidase [Carboxylicivirga sediminis]